MKYSIGELLEIKRDMIISTFIDDYKNPEGDEIARKGQLFLIQSYINDSKINTDYYDRGYVLYSQVDGSLSFWSDYTGEVEDVLDEPEYRDILAETFVRCFKSN